jgi:hypothetical protein
MGQNSPEGTPAEAGAELAAALAAEQTDADPNQAESSHHGQILRQRSVEQNESKHVCLLTHHLFSDITDRCFVSAHVWVLKSRPRCRPGASLQGGKLIESLGCVYLR